MQRGSQPPFYYLFVVPFYEFLPLIFSLLAIRLWAQKQRINRVLGYWIGLILFALLAFTLINWLYVVRFSEIGESSTIPGLLVGGIIVLAGIIYWILRYRSRIITDYELNSGPWELFDRRAVLRR